MEYELKLTPQEQRMALNTVANMLQEQIKSIKRKRNIRDSERAMWLADKFRHLTAVQMAVDTIDRLANT